VIVFGLRLGSLPKSRRIPDCLPHSFLYGDTTREVAVRRPKPHSEVQRVLVDNAADPQLESLVHAGCDRARLMAALELAFLTDESWETLVGMDLRQFKVAVTQIKDCADTIDRLNRSELIYRAAIYLYDPCFAGVGQPPTLPVRLREYAKAVESLREKLGPGHKIWLHVWKAQLVAIVLEATSDPHDREVSAIIAAMLNSPRYSEKTHQAWRLGHREIIEQERKRLQERSSGRVASPRTSTQ
jgi:hypothetical protein